MKKLLLTLGCQRRYKTASKEPGLPRDSPSPPAVIVGSSEQVRGILLYRRKKPAASGQDVQHRLFGFVLNFLRS